MGVQGGYVTYRVNTQTSMPSYPRSGSAVRRRFRDFVVGAVPHQGLLRQRTWLRNRGLQTCTLDVQRLQKRRACRYCSFACKAQAAHRWAPGAVMLHSRSSAAAWSLQALGDLLKTTHRGYFIPPRPEKNPVEGQRASADFVEGRRTALQHYLEQLAAHPVISQSEVLTRSSQDPHRHMHPALTGSWLCCIVN